MANNSFTTLIAFIGGKKDNIASKLFDSFKIAFKVLMWPFKYFSLRLHIQNKNIQSTQQKI